MSSRLNESKSFLDSSLTRKSIKCNTTRVYLTDLTNNNIDNESNFDFKFENKLNSNYVSDPFDMTVEHKKSKISTKDETIKSNSNKFEIEHPKFEILTT